MSRRVLSVAAVFSEANHRCHRPTRAWWIAPREFSSLRGLCSMITPTLALISLTHALSMNVLSLEVFSDPARLHQVVAFSVIPEMHTMFLSLGVFSDPASPHLVVVFLATPTGRLPPLAYLVLRYLGLRATSPRTVPLHLQREAGCLEAPWLAHRHHLPPRRQGDCLMKAGYLVTSLRISSMPTILDRLHSEALHRLLERRACLAILDRTQRHPMVCSAKTPLLLPLVPAFSSQLSQQLLAVCLDQVPRSLPVCLDNLVVAMLALQAAAFLIVCCQNIRSLAVSSANPAPTILILVPRLSVQLSQHLEEASLAQAIRAPEVSLGHPVLLLLHNQTPSRAISLEVWVAAILVWVAVCSVALRQHLRGVCLVRPRKHNKHHQLLGASSAVLPPLVHPTTHSQSQQLTFSVIGRPLQPLPLPRVYSQIPDLQPPPQPLPLFRVYFRT
jgi:hypothetical protein